MINISTMLPKFALLESSDPKQLGIIYMILSQAFVVIAQLIIKGSTIPILIFIYHRSLLICTSLSLTSTQQFYPKRNIALLMMQGLGMAIAAPLFFLSVKVLTLSEGLVINQLNTIWCQFLSACFLNDPLTGKRMRNILTSLLGLILITRPAFLFGNAGLLSDSDHLYGCIIGLIASFALAASYTFVKLVGSNIQSSLKVFYCHLAMGMICGLSMVYMEQDAKYTWNYLIQLIIATGTTYLSHICFQNSLRYDTYASLATYSYINIVFSLLIDTFIFKELPSGLSMLGGALILTSILLSLKNI